MSESLNQRPLRVRPTAARQLSKAKLLRTSLLAVLASTCAFPATAQVSTSIKPYIGRTAYDLQLDSSRKFDGSARVLGLDLDVGLPNGFFVGLGHVRATGGELDFQGGGGNTGIRYKWRRNDTALTLNHALASDLNFFVGLRGGATKVDSGLGTEFKTSGYFIGLALPLQIGPGFLSLSGAIGLNKGTWRDSSGSATDNAVGYSAGLRYSHTITPSISAGAGIKAQRYVYTLENVGLGEVRERFTQIDLFASFAF